jgi:hypothetical protein
VRGGFGEFEHQQAAARAQYPEHGAQGQCLIGDITESKGDGNAIDAVLFKGQCLGVGLHHLDVPSGPFVDKSVATHLEHGGVNVGEYDLTVGSHELRESRSEVAGSTSNIQNGLPRTRGTELDRKALPEAVNASRHQVIHQVIAAGDRVKYAADHAGFCRGVYPGEAEVGGVVIAIGVMCRVVTHLPVLIVAPVLCQRAGKCT